ncbi:MULTISPECIES: acyl-CoA dehydrogenase family protein [Streptomyces]|jgi:glutaryl-CoA dehydrogenase|uniref:acyl-CoA dehydrogenase family protein n=2 Tax=Streptomyces TaxID=1883 RepID=UPI0008EEECF9|nr:MULTISPECIES: acyl-CoA dehydrogenase family protein [unclassified Streptomyces]MDX2729888.1 acyl-CoA dehydrogenase family protein [Streptomyces sp. PA03-2a]MDX3768539.1 acyl-CoA dehydrogenase family protein [Streptomyces sp. AK08-01B]MDX3817870.1 acyl-CoA dehydrogenase family protein [Streptomyces sp. AK08-01A]SFS89296.1 glutaryl-CoA dehydrogenase [Streptomyces sp. ok210]
MSGTTALPTPSGPYLGEGLLPADFYAYEDLLSDSERERAESVRAFLRTQVAPIVDDCWARAEFPFQLVESFGKLGLMDWADPDSQESGPSNLLAGFIALEMAHVDASMATFAGVHMGLAMGTILTCGSDEQKRRWLPAMSRFEKIGAFGLTEPHGGSDVAGGLLTTARRDGDVWILDGAKRWIGNATFADLVVIWARDVETQHVLGFVVEKDTPGFTATKIENKMALRIVQNADIVLDGCRVPEANRLQNANSFKDTAKILRQTRSGVAWQAVGMMFGAYEIALQYAKEREQFGRPIGGFQLVQDLLVKMLGNATASCGMMVRLAQLQDAGVYRDEQSALAKAYCTVRMRENVGWARELLAGNGIILDYKIGRFVADAEAIYSYEGTREIQTLIVGRAVTGGLSAFVR